jgi:hypothetical protein
MDLSFPFNPEPNPIAKLFTSEKDYQRVACNPNKAHNSEVESKVIINNIATMYS